MNDFLLFICSNRWKEKYQTSIHQYMRMVFGKVETNDWQRLNHIDIWLLYTRRLSMTIDYFAQNGAHFTHSLKRSMTFNFHKANTIQIHTAYTCIHVFGFWGAQFFICLFSCACVRYFHIDADASNRSLQLYLSFRFDCWFYRVITCCFVCVCVRFAMRQYFIRGIVCISAVGSVMEYFCFLFCRCPYWERECPRWEIDV